MANFQTARSGRLPEHGRAEVGGMLPPIPLGIAVQNVQDVRELCLIHDRMAVGIRLKCCTYKPVSSRNNPLNGCKCPLLPTELKETCV